MSNPFLKTNWMNILITGIHGFVGSNLVAALKDQHTIYGLDTRTRMTRMRQMNTDL